MVQRSAARFVLARYNYTSSVTEMLQELNWMPLEQRRQSQRLAMLHKINNGLVKMGKDNLNPLSPKSDQHQISPCNINALSIKKVTRIKNMITQDEFS